MKRFVLVSLAVALSSCGGGDPVGVVPTRSAGVSGPSAVTPMATPSPEDTTCLSKDLKGHLSFVDAPAAVGVKLQNPYDHTCGKVYAAIYRINKDNSQNLLYYTVGSLDAKEQFVVALDTPACSDYQVDVVLGTEAPKVPAFSPGYFIGSKVGKDTNCPNPKPTPKPKPTPTPCPDFVSRHAADFAAVCTNRWTIHVTAHGQFRARAGMNTVYETPIANAGSDFTFTYNGLNLLLDRRDNSQQDYQLAYKSASNSTLPCFCLDK